ncbi:sulfite reductase (NADPH) hemoprotein beta-component [Dongia mobilis]|uniref:Sulfite reductase (NADPH) hemoprotein beta-component n=1 Tax=Dongia mobilis TaxID=578943 RepID=A0A4R6WDG2_9PROT|nr:nitrite/sulfite reductase [Dongia mobilis]TDQ77697.1 sulfite reductase (NADPH) hemoprotein beta-component [Dongia mobilis]
MYRYDQFDATFVRERTAQFKGQVARRLAGELTEEEFRPLRLKNGLYLQLHAYMLRVAIPYGELSSKQMRKLAFIARRYDKGYGHFTTRQNIQYNWPRLDDVPAILEHLAEVEMHAIQTSGNCIRNVTSDHFAGVAADEIEDPRVWAEVIRQWSTLHPEFSYLPRKFKIAIIAADKDRAAMRTHDIGLKIVRNAKGELGFAFYTGGGQGRTPIIGPLVKSFVAAEDLLSYLDATLRVYNMHGRRDNIYKARIKILVQALGAEEFGRQVEEEWLRIKDSVLKLPAEEVARIRQYFAPPALEKLPARNEGFEAKKAADPDFARWVQANTDDHKVDGYRIVTISLKPVGGAPGDASADQMDLLADLADAYSLGQIRVTHRQNLVLPYVRQQDLFDLWAKLGSAKLAEANVELVTDIIACPGLDYCNLANARSIPVAQRISRRFSDPKRLAEIGELRLNISGCINACGHHHVGHIGILGVDKKGEEFYQVTLGGSSAEDISLGKILGPAFSLDQITDAIETVVDTYLDLREGPQERFIDTYRRLGIEPFKEKVYDSLKERRSAAE